MNGEHNQTKLVAVSWRQQMRLLWMTCMGRVESLAARDYCDRSGGGVVRRASGRRTAAVALLRRLRVTSVNFEFYGARRGRRGHDGDGKREH